MLLPMTKLRPVFPTMLPTQGWGATETQLRRGTLYPEDQHTAAWQAWEQCLTGLTKDPDTLLPSI